MRKIIFFISLLSHLVIISQVSFTINNGNWGNPNSWNNGVPNNGDTVIINHKIFLDINIKVSKLVINDTLINTNKKIDVTHSFINNGVYDDIGGKVKFNKINNKDIYGVTFFNILEIGTSDTVFTHDTIYVKDLLILKKGYIDVSSGILILRNDSINNGRFGKSKRGQIIGIFTWEKWINRCNGWSNYSAPFNTTYNDIYSNTDGKMIFTGIPNSNFPNFPFINVYEYDETYGWIIPSSADSLLYRGHGYWYWNSDTVFNSLSPSITQKWKISINGSIDLSTPFNFNVKYTTDGWNFIGNPYPGVIDWTRKEWVKVNINNAIYVYNTCTQNYSSYVNGIGVNGGTKFIPSGQGFYIQANGPSPLLISNQRVIRDNLTNLKNNKSQETVIYIRLNDDEIAIRYNNSSTKYFDNEYDALKMLTQKSNIYSFYDSLKFSIDSRSYNSSIIPLMVDTTGTLSFNIQSMDPKYNLFLEDLKLNKFINLKNTSTYQFIDTSGWNHRFNIHIYERSLTTYINDINKLRVSYQDNYVIIYIPYNGKKYYRVYDSKGSLLYFNDTREKNIIIKRKNQVLIVEIIFNGKRFLKKIF